MNTYIGNNWVVCNTQDTGGFTKCACVSDDPIVVRVKITKLIGARLKITK